jgi:enoyl-CoA hydratase
MPSGKRRSVSSKAREVTGGGGEVSLAVDNGVAELTLCAPTRRNALTAQMAAELLDALAEAEQNDGLCALVLLGTGGWFCAGADLAEISRASADPALPETFAAFDSIYEVFVRVAEFCTPTIAAVRGGAVGAGLNLALATDVRIVSRTARLMSGFTRIGVHPGGGHFQLLDQLVGPQRTVALALLGQELSGEDAVAAGLALEAVDDEDVDGRARELASHLEDPSLVRAATRSWRNYRAAASVPPRLLLRAEQAPQMWSFRRRAQRQ